MTLKSQSDNKFNYLSSFNNIPECDLFISNINELTWANETLECYGLKEFSDYPNALATAMMDIEIGLSGMEAPLLWDSFNPVTDNGQHCSILNNSSPGGRVDLYYR